MTPNLSIREAAIAYRRDFGWCTIALCPPSHAGCSVNHIASCRTPGKRPWPKWKGYQDELISVDDLDHQFGQIPDSNVGLILGPVSGLVRIDVDGDHGRELLKIKSGGDLPETLEFTSGGSGSGLLYRIPDGAIVRTTTATGDGEHQELRFQAKGAQTVLPPSIHPTGRKYEWAPGRSPWEIEAAFAPDWLLRELSPNKPKAPPKPASNQQYSESDKVSLAREALAALKKSRSDNYDEWIDVGMALHSVDDSLLSDWIQFSRLSELFREGECAEKWGTFGTGDITLGTLIHMAEQDGWLPPWKRNGSDANAKPSGIVIGACTIKAGSIRRTGAKIVVSISIERDYKTIDLLQLTSATSGRNQVAKAILALVGPGHDIEIAQAIAKLLVDAEERLKSAPAGGQKTVRQIVHDLVPDEFRFTHRTGKGVWSESRRCDVPRGEFLAYTPDKLVRVCMVGIDCPRSDDGVVKEPELLRLIEVALKIEWATLCDTLPMVEADADDLDQRSEAADRFRQMILKIWHTMITFDITMAKPDTKEPQRASKCSLAAKVMRLSKEAGHKATGWQDVQKGYAAFWRYEPVGTTGFKIVLAMRHVLAAQIGVEIPGASNQTALRKLGVRYSVISDTSSVSSRQNDGNRLVVLSDEMTQEILWEPSLEFVDSHANKSSDSEVGE